MQDGFTEMRARAQAVRGGSARNTAPDRFSPRKDARARCGGTIDRRGDGPAGIVDESSGATVRTGPERLSRVPRPFAAGRPHRGLRRGTPPGPGLPPADGCRATGDRPVAAPAARFAALPRARAVVAERP